MKAAIALLADHHIQNVARRMVYEIDQRVPIQFFGSQLPSHVSLKQPFPFESMDTLEAWFEAFSKQIHPFHVDLERVYYDRWEDAAIIGFEVLETPTLRNLHNQINRELKELFVDPSAPHDGDDYRFHLTVELGKVCEVDPFKQYYDSLPEKQTGLSFMAKQIALFLYPRDPIEPGSFICYKILPLTGKA
jgi:2'-5' RNA ligase